MVTKQLLKQAWSSYKKQLNSSSDAKPAEADRLYRETVWPLLLEKWRHEPVIRNFDDHAAGIGVSVHTLGNSPEALTLAALALKADHIVVVHSERTKEYLAQIEKDLGRRIEAYQVDKGNPSDIYKVAKRVLDAHPGSSIAFDITSGTKAMTAGLASAGFFIQAKAREIDIHVFYVDNNDYDSALRRPVPGSEFLVRLPSPYVVFGELQEERALVLYRNGAFKEAQDIFRRMHSEHRAGRYLNLAELAHAYARWSALDFSGAEKSLRKLVSYLRSDAAYEEPLRTSLGTLELQLRGLGMLVELTNACTGGRRQHPGCVRLLADRERTGWLARTLFREAERYERLEHYVLSALHHYRILELTLQHRLAVRGWNPHAFDPERLPSGTLDAFQEVLKTVFGESARLPSPGTGLTLLNMAALLIALEDETVLPIKNDLRELHGALDARNESLLIHGLSPAGKTHVVRLRSLVEKIVESNFPKVPVDEVIPPPQ